MYVPFQMSHKAFLIFFLVKSVGKEKLLRYPFMQTATSKSTLANKLFDDEVLEP